MTERPEPAAAIAVACLDVCEDAVRLLTDRCSREGLWDRWAMVHGRLVDLELRATALAGTALADVRRSLDHLATAVIALRTAVEVDVQRRLDAEPVPVLIEATDDVVALRLEDVVVTARRLAGRRSS